MHNTFMLSKLFLFLIIITSVLNTLVHICIGYFQNLSKDIATKCYLNTLMDVVATWQRKEYVAIIISWLKT